MQLQGELAKAGGIRVYNSAPDAIMKTFKNEGARGLQRGLGPAVSVSRHPHKRPRTYSCMTVHVSGKSMS
jgi:hypothetical protein